MLQRGFGDRLKVEFGVDGLDLDLGGELHFVAADADVQVVGVAGAALPHPRAVKDRFEHIGIGV